VDDDRTQPLPKLKAGRKENSVAQGNDNRERGKREDSWNSVPATQHSSFAVGIPAYIKKKCRFTLLEHRLSILRDFSWYVITFSKKIQVDNTEIG